MRGNIFGGSGQRDLITQKFMLFTRVLCCRWIRSIRISSKPIRRLKNLKFISSRTNMNRFKFFREGIRNIKTVGTVTRSSRFLCEKIIQHSDIDQAKYIVELGAGDGEVTKRMLDKMTSDCKRVAFEFNDKYIVRQNQMDYGR